MPRTILSLPSLLWVLLLLAGPAAAQLDGAAKDPSAPPAGPTVLGQCPDNMDAFADGDEVVSCTCPAAQIGQGAVWGTDTYTADSATCRAAVHAGMIGRQGGTVTVEMLAGQPRHPGTTRNGVQSQNYGAYGASYRFQGEPRASRAQSTPAQPPAATTISQCPDNMTAFADSGEVVTCTCPATQTGQGSVWGTGTYTADSATCRAAVH